MYLYKTQLAQTIKRTKHSKEDDGKINSTEQSEQNVERWLRILEEKGKERKNRRKYERKRNTFSGHNWMRPNELV